MFKNLVPAALLLIIVFYGVPYMFKSAKDVKMSCVATPEMVDTVMANMNINPGTHDTEKLKETVLKAMSTTTDCTKMAGEIQKNIIQANLPPEMQPQEGEQTIKFKSDKEAMEYYRTQY